MVSKRGQGEPPKIMPVSKTGGGAVLEKESARLRGVSEAVSVLLGHADLATTERYVRVYLTETRRHEFLPP